MPNRKITGFVSIARDNRSALNNYKDRYEYIQSSCTDVYIRNKGAFALLYVKGVIATLIDPGRFDLSFFFGLQDATTQGFLHRLNTEGIRSVPDILKNAPLILLVYLFLIFLWNIAVCIAFVLFVLNKRVELWLRVLVILFVGYLVGITGISGLCRYRVPVYPELIFAFAFAVPSFLHFVKRKSPDAGITI